MTLIDDQGTIHYRGYALVVGTIQIHIWHGADFVDTASGEPHIALVKARDMIDEWMVGR
jgi:hypothetical protein